MKITKQLLRRIIREEAKSTKKYDDDSALKGDQDELPDALQKGIIDKTVEDREKNEIFRRHLRRIIRETTQDVLDYPDPASVMSLEDQWSGGSENLHLSIDHASVVHGAEENVKSPEVLSITELRRVIRSYVSEAKKKRVRTRV